MPNLVRRRVQIGEAKGETPQKQTFFYREDAPDSIESATPERAEGAVPMKGALKSGLASMARKQQQQAKLKRSVNVGQVKGETPRKQTYFYRQDAPDTIESATPERTEGAVPMKGVLKATAPLEAFPAADPYSSPLADAGRPTTSRGKSRPSPDEMFDYVVRSPENDKHPVPPTTLVFDSPEREAEAEGSDAEQPETEEEEEDDDDDEQPISFTMADAEPYNESSSESAVSSGSSGADDDDADTLTSAQREELVAIGCWLFGSVLAV